MASVPARSVGSVPNEPVKLTVGAGRVANPSGSAFCAARSLPQVALDHLRLLRHGLSIGGLLVPVAYNLSNTATTSLVALPESGMGFQIVTTRTPRPMMLLVLYGRLAFDISDVQLSTGRRYEDRLDNGFRIMEAITRIKSTVVSLSEPTSFTLVESRIADPAGLVHPGMVPSTGASSTPPSTLIKTYTLTSPRTFHRYSAYMPDRRVDSKGSFQPGTYATPDSEVPFVPTGFAAVGRFALPNVDPASHHYVAMAGSGTVVSFGTVAPAYGQSGGGVEAYFPSGFTNIAATPTPPARIPDE